MKHSNNTNVLCKRAVLSCLLLLILILSTLCFPDTFFDDENLRHKETRIAFNTIILFFNLLFIVNLWNLASSISASRLLKLTVLLSIIVPYLNFLLMLALVCLCQKNPVEKEESDIKSDH